MVYLSYLFSMCLKCEFFEPKSISVSVKSITSMWVNWTVDLGPSCIFTEDFILCALVYLGSSWIIVTVSSKNMGKGYIYFNSLSLKVCFTQKIVVKLSYCHSSELFLHLGFYFLYMAWIAVMKCQFSHFSVLIKLIYWNWYKYVLMLWSKIS